MGRLRTLHEVPLRKGILAQPHTGALDQRIEACWFAHHSMINFGYVSAALRSCLVNISRVLLFATTMILLFRDTTPREVVQGRKATLPTSYFDIDDMCMKCHNGDKSTEPESCILGANTFSLALMTSRLVKGFQLVGAEARGP